MATGLSIPVRLSGKGGFALSSGSQHDNDIIRAALGSDDNENAFQQDLGLGEDVIFDINDSQFRARVASKLRAIFRRFEALKLYRLLEHTMEWEALDGEHILSFKYVNLESDQPQNFSQNFNSSQAHSV